MTKGGVAVEDVRSTLAVDSVHDELTGFVNRDALAVLVEYAIARARRDGECLTLLWFDIDGIDEINTRHGREYGDAAIVEFGELVRGELRSSDVVARMGESEFGVLLSGTDATQAGVVINHVTSVIRERNIDTDRPFLLTALVTRASFEPASELLTFDALMADAIERRQSGRTVAVR
jgi:diguanylate cyclase (GGDEF)-like protein